VSIRYYKLMPETPIYAVIERIANLIRAEERQLGADHGLQPVHLSALYYLSRCNRYSDTPAAVTEYLGMTKGTVSQTLQVLEKKNLLTKTADSEDKRLVHLSLTNDGKRLIRKAIPPISIKKSIDELNQKDAQLIQKHLIQLLTQLQLNTDSRSFGECQTCVHCQKEAGQHRCGLTQQELKLTEIKQICREHTAT